MQAPITSKKLLLTLKKITKN